MYKDTGLLGAIRGLQNSALGSNKKQKKKKKIPKKTKINKTSKKHNKTNNNHILFGGKKFLKIHYHECKHLIIKEDVGDIFGQAKIQRRKKKKVALCFTKRLVRKHQSVTKEKNAFFFFFFFNFFKLRLQKKKNQKKKWNSYNSWQFNEETLTWGIAD